MNNEIRNELNCERTRKALPKSKALLNKDWNTRGGNGAEDPGTVKTTGCVTLGCSGHCQTKAAC